MDKEELTDIKDEKEKEEAMVKNLCRCCKEYKEAYDKGENKIEEKQNDKNEKK